MTPSPPLTPQDNSPFPDLKQLDQFTACMPHLVWVADADGQVLYYSHQVEQFAGAKRHPDGTWSWEGLLYPEDLGPTATAWNKAINEELPYDIEHRVQMADGSYRWHLSRAFPQKNNLGVVSHWIGTATDIHEQKQFEQRALDSEDRLNLALTAGELGSWDYNLRTQNVITSPKHKELFGIPQEQPFTYELFLSCIHEDEREEVKRINDAIISLVYDNPNYELEYRIRRVSDGEVRWLRSKGKIYSNKEGRPVRFTGIAVDVTDEKLAKESLRYKNALLQAQNEAIPDGILIVDARGAILSSNRRFAQIWNMPQEIVDSGDDDAALRFATTLVMDPETFIRRVRDLYRYEEETAGREEIPLKDGRTLERYGRLVMDENGLRYGWAWYFRDITARKKAQAELVKQKDRYQSILGGIADAFVAYDFNWNIIYVNEKASLMANRAASGLVGKKLWDVFPQLVGTRSYEMYNHTMQTREPVQFEHYSPVVNEWMELRVYPTNEGICVFGTNITERKRAESDLLYQKKLLETITGNTALALFMTDENQHCIYMNEAAERITGYTLEELSGKTLHYYIHHSYPDGTPYPREACPIGGVLHEKKRLKGEEVFVHKDGSFYPVAYTASPILVDNRHLGTVIELRNTAEEKRAEQVLRESEAQFRQLADLIPQIIWTANANGVVDYYNSRWYEFTGYSPGDHMPSWSRALHPDDQPFALHTWARSVNTGEPYVIEYRFFHAGDKSYRWFLGQALPIRDNEGRITKWFGTCTDIDDQKRFTEKLEKLVRERTEELQRSNEDLQQFAHVASHDLKEPLRKIRTFSSRLAEELSGNLPPSAAVYLEKMEAAASRMGSMIDGVLSYSLFSSSEKKLESIDLGNVLRDIEADLEMVIAQKEASLHYNDLPTIEANPVLINQLFYNLINNSLKFARPGVPPEILVSGEIISGEAARQEAGLPPDGLYAAVAVRDNGIGFDPLYAESIFKTFTRLNAKDKYEGTGLGLSLCRKIVLRHGGHISATGEEGKGSTFRMLLPVKQRGR